MDLQLHKQMTGRHTPTNPQNLLGIPNGYFDLSSNYVRVSTLMVGTPQAVEKKNYITCKAKIRNS